MANGRKIPSYPSYQENIQRDSLCSACGSNKRLSMSIVTRMVAMSNSCQTSKTAVKPQIC